MKVFFFLSAGLDPTGFRQGGREEEGGREGASNEDKYKDCAMPTIVCPSCAKVVTVAGATVNNILWLFNCLSWWCQADTLSPYLLPCMPNYPRHGERRGCHGNV